jgi:hypothetical protein
MLAVAGFVLAVIAAALELTKQHLGAVTWLLIIAVALACAESAWGWNRGGRYGRRGGP